MLQRLVNFFKDLFMGPGNTFWDLGRIAVGVSLATEVGAAIFNMIIGEQVINLLELGTGIAAILTAGAALIAAKDIAKAKNDAVAITAAQGDFNA